MKSGSSTSGGSLSSLGTFGGSTALGGALGAVAQAVSKSSGASLRIADLFIFFLSHAVGLLL